MKPPMSPELLEIERKAIHGERKGVSARRAFRQIRKDLGWYGRQMIPREKGATK